MRNEASNPERLEEQHELGFIQGLVNSQPAPRMINEATDLERLEEQHNPAFIRGLVKSHA